MAVLVTGGTGYIESHTIIQLIEAGNEVGIVDNLSNINKVVLNHIEGITRSKVKSYQKDLVNINEPILNASILRYFNPVRAHSSGRIGEEISWETQYEVKEMCQDSWRWQEGNPNGYEAK